ncbi:MAG TPA: response regulator [Puia sp.]|nr:response regulator [Puia sp.]
MNRSNYFALLGKFGLLMIATAFFTLPALDSSAQNPAEVGLPFVTNFRPKDFQAYPQAWATCEDDRGLIYIGNQGYILQYDGVTWKKISVANNGTVAIRAIVKNKNGLVYYASISDFGYLAPDSIGQMRAISLLKYIPDSLRDFNDVWSIQVTPEGVYFQAREILFRFKENKNGDGVTGEFKTWRPVTRFMYSFYYDGTLFVHLQELGLYKMVNDQLVKIPGSEFLGKERMQVMLPYPGKDGSKAYAFGLFYSGLYLYDGQKFSKLHTQADSLLAATLYKGTILRDGSYALATAGKGLVIINKDGKLLQLINRQAGLQDESVYSVFQDSNGSVWLTLDNGVSRLETASPLSQFTIQSGVTTAALCVRRFNGNLYLGTTNGLLHYNSTIKKFEPDRQIATNQVFAFLPMDDEMLIATDGLFSIKNKKVLTVAPSISGNLQLAMLYAPKNFPNLVVAGDAIRGMVVFQRKKRKNKDETNWEKAGYFSDISTQGWTFAEDKEGTLWMGSQNETVFRIHIVLDEKGDIDMKKCYSDKFGPANGLGRGCGPVYAVDGKVYFAADSALYAFDGKDHFTKDLTFGSFPNGGGKDEVFMAEDQTGRVWIRFGKETAIASKQADGHYKLDRTPLLPIAERTFSQIYPEATGINWICTTDGLVRYDENLKKNYNQPFKTMVRKVEAGNSYMNPDASDSDREKISIAYKHNNLRIEYAGVFFEQEDKTKYQTWLEGFEKRWSDWGTNTYKEYTNLSEGSYKFHVRSKNVYQVVGDEAIYAFTVDPPWSRTWWAYALYILVVLAILYFIIRYRTGKLHEQRLELEKKVQERTHEVQVQAEELTTVNQISQALASQLNLDDLIKLVGDEMRRVFKANIVYLAMWDKKTNMINFPYQYGEKLPPMKFGEGIASKIINTGKPLLLNKNLNQRISELGIQRLGMPAASYLGVPIPIDNEVTGVLSVQSTTKENYFDEKDLRLLSTIAANVGVALKKARLFEEVKHAKLEAEEASKAAEKANDAKSAFLSTVSHELRTPLTSVLGFAKIIKKRLEERIFPVTDRSDPKTDKAIGQVTENLHVVISEGERLTHLINDVLDLAKIEAGKMEWNMENVSIPEIVERAIAATSSLFYQRDIKLEKSIEPDLPRISGDQDKLIQVVVNLISNAVKFTDQGSVTCKVISKGSEIITSITDTGIGIAQKDLGVVFEQFKQLGGDTLTDKPKGTGLGLPICKEIVEHHGGHIWVESTPGKGSTFLFALPMVKSAVVAKPLHLDELVKQLRARMQQSAFNHTNKSNATILVVDDDDSIRSLLRQEFTDAGYLVEETSNGKDALKIIRENRPDLIVLDVMMPEMNGFDTAAVLKNDPQTMDIPIIILSIVQDKARGYRIGVDRYLTKPIDTAKLFSEVGTLLEQGKSRKKVMVVDDDSTAVNTLTEVLETKGYQVVESDGKELVERAIASQPDIIILNSLYQGKQEIVQTLRFEKGLENVLFLIYQ